MTLRTDENMENINEETQINDEAQKNEEEQIRVESIIYSCSSCGGNLKFNPDTQSLHCPYCGNEQAIEPTCENIKENDFTEGIELSYTDWGSEAQSMHCDNCGADVVLEMHKTAQSCPFCNSSHVVCIEDMPGIKPESVIPFKISEKKALGLFTEWIKKKFFAPKQLKTNHQINKMRGVYIPYWTYDSDTSSSYQAEKGTYYYVTETYWVNHNGKRVAQTRTVRKTRWEYVKGIYNQFFNDELVNASANTDEMLAGKISAFNFKELVDYNPEYLTGFIAEKYSINLKDGWGRATEAIKSKIRQGIIQKINGDEVRNLNFSTRYSNITYKHLLLPLWICAYNYRQKSYRFMINGQTGQIIGTAPVSIPKIIGAVITGILAVLILIGLYSRFGM